MNFYLAVIGYLGCVGLLTKLAFSDLNTYNYIYGFSNLNIVGLFGCFLAMGLVTLKYDWGLAPYFLRQSLNIKEVKK